MATQAINSGYEEIFWIDSDMGFEVGDVEKARSHNADIVTGLYSTRNGAGTAAEYLPNSAPSFRNPKLQEIKYSGLGFFYAKRKVYEAIQAVHCKISGRPVRAWFLPMISDESGQMEYLREDFSFCHRARQAGFKIMVDTSIKLRHYGRMGYDLETPKSIWGSLESPGITVLMIAKNNADTIAAAIRSVESVMKGVRWGMGILDCGGNGDLKSFEQSTSALFWEYRQGECKSPADALAVVERYTRDFPAVIYADASGQLMKGALSLVKAAVENESAVVSGQHLDPSGKSISNSIFTSVIHATQISPTAFSHDLNVTLKSEAHQFACHAGGMNLSAESKIWTGYSRYNLPGIQVVMAVRNVEQYIDRALESIERSMAGQKWILVVGDDASDDRTLTKIRQYSKNSTASFCLIERFEKAPNVSIAKNRVIEMGRPHFEEYPCIAFMDGDDEVLEPRMQYMLPRMVQGGHIFVHGDWETVEANGSISHTKARQGDRRFGGPPMTLMHHSIIPPNSHLFWGALPANEDLICWEHLEHQGFRLTAVPGKSVHRYYKRQGSVSQWDDKTFREDTRRRAEDLILNIRSNPRLGLVGWNTAQGLGYLNRSLVKHMRFDHWLIPRHPKFDELQEYGGAHVSHCDIKGGEQMEEFLKRVDWIVFCELPYIDALPEKAAAAGVKMACIPMQEYLHENSPWLYKVDLLLCPTRQCFELLTRWKPRLQFKAEIELLPWPIDLDEFRFTQRTKCERFVFFNGTGGVKANLRDGSKASPRKGADIVASAASLCPEIPILIRTQKVFHGSLPAFTSNCQVLFEVEDNTQLYSQGDIAIGPSRNEGIGLQLLECQASGIPLITTDGQPMLDYNPIATIKATNREANLIGQRWFEMTEADPVDLARLMREWIGRDISAESRAAREFIERQHSWSNAAAIFKRRLGIRD